KFLYYPLISLARRDPSKNRLRRPSERFNVQGNENCVKEFINVGWPPWYTEAFSTSSPRFSGMSLNERKLYLRFFGFDASGLRCREARSAKHCGKTGSHNPGSLEASQANPAG